MRNSHLQNCDRYFGCFSFLAMPAAGYANALIDALCTIRHCSLSEMRTAEGGSAKPKGTLRD